MTDPLDAQERATKIVCLFTDGKSPSYASLHEAIAEQIRQAEQAARKKALEDFIGMLSRLGCVYAQGHDLVEHARALSEET